MHKALDGSVTIRKEPAMLKSRIKTSLYAPVFALLLLCGCGADPVATSEIITLNIGDIDEDDIDNGLASTQKKISTEEGNPYADFLGTIEEALGDEAPGAIEIHSIALHVHSDSKGVSDFATVFANLDVFISTKNTTLTLGHIETPTGSTIRLAETSGESLDSVQRELANGSFELGVRGQTQPSIPDDFDLEISLEARFSAYQ